MEPQITEKNFADIIPEGNDGISGRDKGEQLRERWSLDDLEKQDDVIIIMSVPDKKTLGQSFIQGLFSKSVLGLGEQRFNEIYKFIASPIVLQSIENAKKSILARSRQGAII